VKLADRHQVEGTAPAMQIGRRVGSVSSGGKVGRKYWVQYCLDGKHHYEPTGTTNKAVAIRRAHAIAQRIGRGEERRVVPKHTLKDVVKQYLDLQRNRGRAGKTMVKYTQVLSDLVEWFEEPPTKPASAFTEMDFWAFRQWMIHQKLAPKTVADRLTIAKQVFKFAVKQKLILVNPVDGATVPDAPATVQPCFLPEQVGVLLAKAGEFMKIVIAILAFTGMRVGELRDLRWTDVLLDQGSCGFIVVQRGGSGGTTKSRKVRRIPIHPELKKILKTLPRKFDRVVTAPPCAKYPDGGAPINDRTILKKLKGLCRLCKFPSPDSFKTHSLRHAFCSMCARNNVSYKYALEWMGHSSSDILDLYYRMFDETAEVAMKTIVYPAPVTAIKNGGPADVK
jgi:integrase